MRHLAALLLVVGCEEPSLVVALVPDLPDSVTHIGALAFSEGGEFIHGTPLIPLSEVSTGKPLALGAAVSEMLVVGYERGQLDPSKLPGSEVLRSSPLEFGAEDGPVLPTPAYAAQGEPSEAVALTQVSLARKLTADWVGPCARRPCERFQFGRALELSVPGETEELSRWEVTLPGRRSALLFRDAPDTPIYRFSEPDRVEILTPSLPGPRLRGARVSRDGQVVLLQENGRVWLGTADGDFRLHEGSLPETESRSLAVSRTTDPFEIYMQDAYSDVYVLTATTWRRIHVSGLPYDDGQDLEWVRPNELAYVAPEADRLLRFDASGVLAQERLPSIRTLLHIPGLGLVISAGTLRTEVLPSLFVWDHEGLRRLDAPLPTRAPLRVWPTGWPEELIFGGVNGEIGYLGEELGLCELDRQSDEGLRSVSGLEGGLLIVPARAGDEVGETRVFFAAFEEAPRPNCETAYRADLPAD